jgi:hypothetical protein
MKFKLTVILGILVLMLNCLSVEAKASIQKIVYKGWIDSYRISSGDYSLVVVPEIGGRIMEYSFNGENVIWEDFSLYGITFPITNEWHNYGGSKTWIAPQTLWGWPPDPMMDYGKCNAEVINADDGSQLLRVTGAPSLKLGTLITKDISLNDSGEALIKQSIRNISDKPITCGVWGISYMRTPSLVAFPVKPKSKFPNGVAYFNAESKSSKQFSVKDGICITNYQGEQCLIGSDSDGPWMVWFKDQTAYIKIFDAMEKGFEYPNGGCSVQVLTGDSKSGYLEMEIYGPITKLKPGEFVSSTERWRIQELSQPVYDETGVVKAIKGMKGKNWIPG